MKIFIKNRKRKMLWIICAILIIILTYTYIYFKVTQAEPYQLSKKYLTENKDVISYIGKPERFRISIFGGHDIRYFLDAEPQAKFKITIYGTKDNGNAVVELEKKENVWQITNAELILKNDKKIKLDKGLN